MRKPFVNYELGVYCKLCENSLQVLGKDRKLKYLMCKNVIPCGGFKEGHNLWSNTVVEENDERT